jgi:hypothetical protein
MFGAMRGPLTLQPVAAGDMQVLPGALKLQEFARAGPDRAVSNAAWTDQEAQEVLGPVRVNAYWREKPDPRWIRMGSVCGFVLDEFGELDGLTSGTAFAGMGIRNVNLCQFSGADERMHLYTFSMPEPRCERYGLILVHVPWTFMEETEATASLNERMARLKGKAYLPLGPVELAASQTCRARMKRLIPLPIFATAAMTPLALALALILRYRARRRG